MFNLKVTSRELTLIELTLSKDSREYEEFIESNERFRADAETVTEGMHWATMADYWREERQLCSTLLQKIKEIC